MKRLSVLLIIALLAGTVSGCRYAVVEGDPMRALGLTAEAEGYALFGVDDPDLSFLDEEPVDLTPSPSPTPRDYDPDDYDPTPTPRPTSAHIYGVATSKMPKVQVTPSPTPETTPEPTKMPKVQVTPTPKPADISHEETVIGLHSRDEEGENKVRKLQERLVALGYLETEPDGVFGSRTLKALKRFQKDQGLEESGVLDTKTKTALYPAPEVTTAPKDVKYAEGAVGSDIRLIHQKLRLYGFSHRAVSSKFDEETTEEIMKFQSYAVKYYGTEFDDRDTLGLPEEDGLRVASIFVPDVTETPTAQPEATVAPTPEPETDPFGIPTMPVLEPEATLRPYHATDGVVSENLYYYLLSGRFPVYRLTVQQGDEGEEVERIQHRLHVLDFYYNDVSGVFDEFTREALKAFQMINGLQETGIADPDTQRLLFSDEAKMAEQVDMPYYIKVSLKDQRVYVYRWLVRGYDQLIKSMICSTGLEDSTPRGVFVSPGHRDTRWHYFIEFNCWAQWAFVITGNILFHSVIYSDKDESSLRYSTLENLGHRASHGCVRLRVEDAHWIYDNCGAGQVVEVY